MYEHLTEIVYARGYEQELKEQEASLTAFSFATQVPVTFFSTRGEALWECNREAKICRVNSSYGVEGTDCTNVIRSAMNVSSKLGEVYIFECHAGLIKMCYPLTLGDRDLGYYIAGPILMGDSKNRSLKNFYRKAPLGDVDFPSLAVILNELPYKTPKEVNYLSMMFYNSLMSYMIKDRPGEKYRQINSERADTVTKIIQMKEASLEVAYPSQTEMELLFAIKNGDEAGSEKTLSRYLEEIMVFDAGNIQVVKVRLLNLFSRLFSPDSDVEESYESFSMIEDIGNAEDMKRIFELSKKFVKYASEKMAASLYSGKSKIVSQAIRLIHGSYSEDLTLTSMADRIHVNPSYLSTLFHREMEASIVNYLTEVRLTNAARMLKATSENVSEVAAACGFREPNYFSRIFKRKFGVTPREYRAK